MRLLQLGKLRGHARSLGRAQFGFREVVREAPETAWHLVGDLPGGTRQPFFGWGRFARTVLVVVEPTGKSLLSARRLARLGEPAGGGDAPPRLVAVANKVQHESDAGMIERRAGLEVIATVPWGEAVREAERAGRALLDVAPRSPVVTEVESLLERLLHEEVPA